MWMREDDRSIGVARIAGESWPFVISSSQVAHIIPISASISLESILNVLDALAYILLYVHCSESTNRSKSTNVTHRPSRTEFSTISPAKDEDDDKSTARSRDRRTREDASRGRSTISTISAIEITANR